MPVLHVLHSLYLRVCRVALKGSIAVNRRESQTVTSRRKSSMLASLHKPHPAAAAAAKKGDRCGTTRTLSSSSSSFTTRTLSLSTTRHVCACVWCECVCARAGSTGHHCVVTTSFLRTSCVFVTSQHHHLHHLHVMTLELDSRSYTGSLSV